MKLNGNASKKTRVFRLIAALLLTAVASVSAYNLLKEFYVSAKGRSYYSSINEATERRDNNPAASPRVFSNGDQEIWSPYVDFAALSEKMPDIVAWVKIEGTTIDFPVVRGTDNDFYLSHLPDGESNKMGSIFMDYRNTVDFSDINTVIYGHNMNNYEMFGLLEHYKEQAFFEEHPIIEIYTPEADYRAELLAGYVFSGSNQTLPFKFKSDESLLEYISEAKLKSVFDSGAQIESGDRILTVITCTYNYNNARLVFAARLEDVN